MTFPILPWRDHSKHRSQYILGIVIRLTINTNPVYYILIVGLPLVKVRCGAVWWHRGYRFSIYWIKLTNYAQMPMMCKNHIQIRWRPRVWAKFKWMLRSGVPVQTRIIETSYRKSWIREIGVWSCMVALKYKTHAAANPRVKFQHNTIRLTLKILASQCRTIRRLTA